MRVLLDTHSFLWFIEGNSKISTKAREIIDDTLNQPLLSIASIWEIAIKFSLKKLNLKQPFETLIPEQLELTGVELLSIEFAHVRRVAVLPFHHRDPFDRLLVAQALVEQLPLVSGDNALDAYPINRLW
jgi:PIN domain nuclease of toxin-antitoxin system